MPVSETRFEHPDQDVADFRHALETLAKYPRLMTRGEINDSIRYKLSGESHAHNENLPFQKYLLLLLLLSLLAGVAYPAVESSVSTRDLAAGSDQLLGTEFFEHSLDQHELVNEIERLEELRQENLDHLLELADDDTFESQRLQRATELYNQITAEGLLHIQNLHGPDDQELPELIAAYEELFNQPEFADPIIAKIQVSFVHFSLLQLLFAPEFIQTDKEQRQAAWTRSFVTFLENFDEQIIFERDKTGSPRFDAEYGRAEIIRNLPPAFVSLFLLSWTNPVDYPEVGIPQSESILTHLYQEIETGLPDAHGDTTAAGSLERQISDLGPNTFWNPEAMASLLENVNNIRGINADALNTLQEITIKYDLNLTTAVKFYQLIMDDNELVVAGQTGIIFTEGGEELPVERETLHLRMYVFLQGLQSLYQELQTSNQFQLTDSTSEFHSFDDFINFVFEARKSIYVTEISTYELFELENLTAQEVTTEGNEQQLIAYQSRTFAMRIRNTQTFQILADTYFQFNTQPGLLQQQLRDYRDPELYYPIHKAAMIQTFFTLAERYDFGPFGTMADDIYFDNMMRRLSLFEKDGPQLTEFLSAQIEAALAAGIDQTQLHEYVSFALSISGFNIEHGDVFKMNEAVLARAPEWFVKYYAGISKLVMKNYGFYFDVPYHLAWEDETGLLENALQELTENEVTDPRDTRHVFNKVLNSALVDSIMESHPETEHDFSDEQKIQLGQLIVRLTSFQTLWHPTESEVILFDFFGAQPELLDYANNSSFNFAFQSDFKDQYNQPEALRARLEQWQQGVTNLKEQTIDTHDWQALGLTPQQVALLLSETTFSLADFRSFNLEWGYAFDLSPITQAAVVEYADKLYEQLTQLKESQLLENLLLSLETERAFYRTTGGLDVSLYLRYLSDPRNKVLFTTQPLDQWKHMLFTLRNGIEEKFVLAGIDMYRLPDWFLIPLLVEGWGWGNTNEFFTSIQSLQLNTWSAEQFEQVRQLLDEHLAGAAPTLAQITIGLEYVYYQTTFKHKMHYFFNENDLNNSYREVWRKVGEGLGYSLPMPTQLGPQPPVAGDLGGLVNDSQLTDPTGRLAGVQRVLFMPAVIGNNGTLPKLEGIDFDRFIKIPLDAQGSTAMVPLRNINETNEAGWQITDLRPRVVVLADEAGQFYLAMIAGGIDPRDMLAAYQDAWHDPSLKMYEFADPAAIEKIGLGLSLPGQDDLITLGQNSGSGLETGIVLSLDPE